MIFLSLNRDCTIDPGEKAEIKYMIFQSGLYIVCHTQEDETSEDLECDDAIWICWRYHLNITVYLGANKGNDPMIEEAARELGSWIGTNRHTLIYGGSKCGMMGVLAESALIAGGRVIGVEPRFFIDMGFDYDAITELIITDNMSQRKAKMIELGDAFIAFPGGTGTLEEISEIMSMVSLGHTSAPCVIYNLNGYYDDLRNLLNHMTAKEFTFEEKLRGIHFVNNLSEIQEVLSARQ